MLFTIRKQLGKIKSFSLICFEKVTGNFLTIHNRPIFAKEVKTFSENVSSDATAIVMQGRIVETHNFTLETIFLYKKLFPKTHIILSTWELPGSDCIERIKKAGATVLLNEELAFPGVSHINYQILSTSAGIKKARELDAIHVLKTRTDQRIYNPNTLAYFDTAMEVFPLQIEGHQKKRLIVINMNTFKYRPYSVSDMLMYGTIDDMEKYWCIPFSERKNDVGPGHSIIEWVKDRQAEVYLSTQFLESIGHTPLYTLTDSWRAYRDHFCILDKEVIDIYWYKYEKHKEYRRLRYDAIYNDQELNFGDWLMLYNRVPMEVPEDIINQQFGKPILQK